MLVECNVNGSPEWFLTRYREQEEKISRGRNPGTFFSRQSTGRWSGEDRGFLYFRVLRDIRNQR